jgi:hypothetical protein
LNKEYLLKNNSTSLSGLFFFIGIIGLSSFLAQHSLFSSFLFFLVCIFSALYSFYYQNYNLKNFIILIGLIVGLILGLKNQFCLIPVSILFYYYFSQTSKWECILWEASCVGPALITIMNILGYWGMPGSIFIIWLWALPFFLFVTLFFYFFHKKISLIFIILIICGSFLAMNNFGLYFFNNECIGIAAEPKQSEFKGVTLNLLKNITEKGTIFTLPEAEKRLKEEHSSKKWIISLVDTPSLNPEWLNRNTLSGEYYIFAEHNNLTSFIGQDSPFNDDSFQRKAPWTVYKPTMNNDLFQASRKDIVYCSNIGCTIKKDLFSYPLVWSYTKFGIPILLAKGIFDGKRRFVFIGDSDPIGDFLAPYNPFWIKALLGIPNPSGFIIAFLFLILSFSCLNKQKYRALLLILVIGGSCLIDKLDFDIQPTVDVSVNATGKWLSPHYPFHFSSLPKNLAQENLTVTVQRKRVNANLDIEIITKKKFKINSLNKKNKNYNVRLIFLLPQASIITPDGTEICSGEIPLGSKILNLKNKKIFVEDTRELLGNSKDQKDCYLFISPDTYIISTASPQTIKGLSELLS